MVLTSFMEQAFFEKTQKLEKGEHTKKTHKEIHKCKNQWSIITGSSPVLMVIKAETFRLPWWGSNDLGSLSYLSVHIKSLKYSHTFYNNLTQGK